MKPESIRVVVADDHAVVREGIRHVLERVEGLEVVAEAGDGDEALALVKQHEPDLLVLDITMPGRSGLDVTRTLRRAENGLGILILSMHDDPEYVLEAVRTGADGYVLKDSDPSELRAAVVAVHEGREYLSERVTLQLSRAVRAELEQQQRRSRIDLLTPREKEVLLAVAGGRTSREIGALLGISPRTVETHRERVMSKLRIRTIAGLTRFVVETGLTGPDPSSEEGSA